MDAIDLFAAIRPEEPGFSASERAELRAAILNRRDRGSVQAADASEFDDNWTPVVVGSHIEGSGARVASRRRLLAAAVILLIAGGGTAIWSLSTAPNETSFSSASSSSLGVGNAGDPAATFSYSVSSFDGTAFVFPTSVDQSGVCFSVAQQHQSSNACVDAATIASGQAWALYGEPDGTWLLIGVVPDEVDEVRVDGRLVDLAGNVWSTRIESGEVTLEIGSSSTGLRVSQVVGTPTPAPTTTL